MSSFPRRATDVGLCAIICMAIISGSSIASERTFTPAAQQELHLAVYINGVPTNLAGKFTADVNGRLFVQAAELRELGIKPPAGSGMADIVELGGASAISYRYDAVSQSLYFTLSDQQREVAVHDASAPHAPRSTVARDFGAVLNYNAFASAAQDQLSRLGRFSNSAAGINVTLDARVFGPFGTFGTTAIVGGLSGTDESALRLETNWALSDPDTLATYRLGDTIAGGVAWSRPYRLAGAQIQRNFGLRSDLVTAPLPSFSGSAAVPSVVDVYINGMKTYSQDVGAGPFQLNNVPAITGAGEARVVVRDSSGREVETRRAYFTSPLLLRPGMTDFSVEAGLPRIGFGITSSDYLGTPVVSASARHGVYDWLTLEGHAEAGGSLVSAGGGGVFRIATAGTISAGSQLSWNNGDFGALGYAALDLQFRDINLHASTQRTTSNYADIVSATARSEFKSYLANPLDSTTSLLTTRLAQPPRALDTLSVGIPLRFDNSTISLSLIHIEPFDTAASDLVNISYNRPIFATGSLFVSAYSDLRNKDNSGIIAGISFPLGGNATATVGGSLNDGARGISVDATKPLDVEPGSYGWRVTDTEGTNANRSAALAYRSQIARSEGRVTQDNRTVRGSLEVEGSVALMGGGVHLSNRIDDAFAVVSTGSPGVDVSYENRRVGRTGSDGTLLVPNLRSFQTNRIDIDATTLKTTAEVGKTTLMVTPADRGGAIVDFAVTSTSRSAIVIIKRADGRFPEAGATATLKGAAEPHVIGYDGKVYLKELTDQNELTITSAAGDCRASFPMPKAKSIQTVIGPITCQ